MNTQSNRCLNCDQPLEENYCKFCGQRSKTRRLTIRGTVADFFDKYFDMESGLLHTFVQMCIRPGRVILEYCHGKRRTFVNPFAYALFGTAVSILLLNLTLDSSSVVLDSFRMMGQMMQLSETQLDLFVEVQLEGIQYTSLLTAVTCIPFAVILRVMFPRREFCIAELMAFSLFVLGHVFYVDVLTYPIQYWFGFNVASLLTFLIYVLVAAHATLGFFGATVWNVARTVTAIIMSVVLVQIAVLILQVIYVRLTIPDVPV